MNKLFLCCLIISSIFTQQLWAKKGDAADRKKHADYYEKYDKHLNEQIDALPDLTGCDDIDYNQTADLEECVKSQLSGMEESDALKIEEILELKTHNLIKSKKKKDIVNFLGNKFEDRLYGNKKEKRTRKDRQLVDDADYITLYKSQLANNVLLEVSTFCREKVTVDNSCLPYGRCTIDKIRVGKKNEGILKQEFKELTEVEADGKPIAALKYSICMNKMKELCEASDSSNNNHEACLLRQRMVKTEKAIAQTTKIQKGYEKHNPQGGFQYKHIGGYAGVLDKRKLEDIGALTSDLVHDSKAKDELDELEKEFKRECDSDSKSEACKEFFNVLTENDLNSIKNKLGQKESITKLKLDSIQKNDEDKLKEIAKKYLNKKELEMDIADIRKKLDDELKRQKEAIIKSIEDKIAKGTGKEEVVEDIDVGNELNKKENLQRAKADALRDNIFYSNMVNSYLSRTQGEGKNKKTSDNSKFRERELQGASNIQDAGQYTENVKLVQKFIDEQSSSKSGQGKQDEVSGTLDQIKGLFDIIVRGEKGNK